MKRSGLIALSFAALALPAVADTIYFKDGSSLSGTVLREDTTHVVLKLPQGRMTFPVEDVERVEEDDNPPSAKPAPPDTPMDAEEPAPALRELDKEDRRRLRLMLNDLLSTDAAARNAARQRIERFGQDRDLFPFLERALPYMPDRQSVEVLQLLTNLDPQRAKPVLESAARSRLEDNRAKALALLASTNKDTKEPNPELVQLFAQGVLDEAAEVQLAGIQGLQQLNDKRVTPVLVHALGSPDPRVRSASLHALKALWPDAAVQQGLDSPEAWRTFLSRAGDEVRSTFDPQHIEPLVDAPAAGDVDYNLNLE